MEKQTGVLIYRLITIVVQCRGIPIEYKASEVLKWIFTDSIDA